MPHVHFRSALSVFPREFCETLTSRYHPLSWWKLNPTWRCVSHWKMCISLWRPWTRGAWTRWSGSGEPVIRSPEVSDFFTNSLCTTWDQMQFVKHGTIKQVCTRIASTRSFSSRCVDVASCMLRAIRRAPNLKGNLRDLVDLSGNLNVVR